MLSRLIAEKKTLTDDLKAKMNKAIEAFKKKFAPTTKAKAKAKADDSDKEE